MRVQITPPALARVGGDFVHNILVRRTPGSKAQIPGQDVGWRDWTTAYGGQFKGRKPLPGSLDDYLATYGGTDDSIVWVYACATLIANEVASYDWHCEAPDEDEIPLEKLPEELRAILRFPSAKLTWYSFVMKIFLDLELAGNSYWLKDNVNKLGQPGELMRLRPELMKVVPDDAGRVAGYVYRLGAIEIPYEEEDVIHFKYENPLDDLYGMGTVEAIQRDLNAELRYTDHVVGFFEQGGRISGVLTLSETVSAPQFQRMKEQFEQASRDPAKFRILMVEQGAQFTPITSPPPELGIIDLRRMSKDVILSAFGVPEFLLGGSQAAGIYKMSEAQRIMTRRLHPKKTQVEQEITQSLVSFYGEYTFMLDATAAEEPEDMAALAASSMGTGPSLNELREMQGLPRIDQEEADEPLLSSGVVLFSSLIAPPEPEPQPFGLPNGQPELPPDEQLALPPGEDEEDVQSTPPTADEAAALEAQAAATVMMLKARDLTFAQIGQLLGCKEDLTRHLYHVGLTGKAVVRPFSEKARIRLPRLPEGFEPLGDSITLSHADPDIGRDLLLAQIGQYEELTSMVRKAMQEFFVGQRKRVVKKTLRFTDSEKTARATKIRAHVGRKPRLSKKQLDSDAVWDDKAEDKALLVVYLKLLDEIARRAIEAIGRILQLGINWSLENPNIEKVRDILGERIVGINKTTKAKVADTIRDGLARGYSIPQIANGFEEERFPGIQGVFDQANAARAETIARTETGTVYNAASLLGYGEAGIEEVEVVDGIEWDDNCREANGSVWKLEYAAAHPLEHPNCTRALIPIVPLPPSPPPTPKVWRESQHPRDDEGQFAEKPGLGGAMVASPYLGDTDLFREQFALEHPDDKQRLATVPAKQLVQRKIAAVVRRDKDARLALETLYPEAHVQSARHEYVPLEMWDAMSTATGRLSLARSLRASAVGDDEIREADKVLQEAQAERDRTRDEATLYVQTGLFINQWAKSSGDHHQKSLRLQNAIADEFGLSMGHLKNRYDPDEVPLGDAYSRASDIRNDIRWAKHQRDEVRRMRAEIEGESGRWPDKERIIAGLLETYPFAESDELTDVRVRSLEKLLDQIYAPARARHEETRESVDRGLRVLVRAMYDDTQKFLKERGVKSARLYRGATYGYTTTEGNERIDNPFEFGIHKASVSHQPASSYTMDASTASAFAGMNDGALVGALVPAERIFAFPQTGFGALGEVEVLILSGQDDEAYVWAWHDQGEARPWPANAGLFQQAIEHGYEGPGGADLDDFLAAGGEHSVYGDEYQGFQPGDPIENFKAARRKRVNLDTYDLNADWIKQTPDVDVVGNPVTPVIAEKVWRSELHPRDPHSGEFIDKLGGGLRIPSLDEIVMALAQARGRGERYTDPTGVTYGWGGEGNWWRHDATNGMDMGTPVGDNKEAAKVALAKTQEMNDKMKAYRKNPTPEGEIFDGFTYGGITARVLEHTGRNAVGGVLIKDGKMVGDFGRTFKNYETPKRVQHEQLWIVDPTLRGAGFAHAFNERSYAEYRKLGYKQVRLLTSNVGGYAWARAGYSFVPPSETPDQLLEDFERAERMRFRDPSRVRPDIEWPEDQLNEFFGMFPIHGGPFRSEADIAGWGREHSIIHHGREWWIGKWFMMDQAWFGELNLDDLKGYDPATVANAYRKWADKQPIEGRTFQPPEPPDDPRFGVRTDAGAWYDDDADFWDSLEAGKVWRAELHPRDRIGQFREKYGGVWPGQDLTIGPADMATLKKLLATMMPRTWEHKLTMQMIEDLQDKDRQEARGVFFQEWKDTRVTIAHDPDGNPVGMMSTYAPAKDVNVSVTRLTSNQTTKGIGSRQMAEAARLAASLGKGIQLESLSEAVPFYETLGMEHAESYGNHNMFWTADEAREFAELYE